MVFGLLFFQPALGWIHHRAYQQTGSRVVWSHAHIWLGRILITLGIINGGLGLQLADNTTAGEIAYGVIAGLVWLVYLGVAVYGEWRRHADRKVLSGEEAAMHKTSSADSA